MHYRFIELVNMSTRDLRQSINIDLTQTHISRGMPRVTKSKSLSSGGSSEAIHPRPCISKTIFRYFLAVFYHLKNCH